MATILKTYFLGVCLIGFLTFIHLMSPLPNSDSCWLFIKNQYRLAAAGSILSYCGNLLSTPILRLQGQHRLNTVMLKEHSDKKHSSPQAIKQINKNSLVRHKYTSLINTKLRNNPEKKRNSSKLSQVSKYIHQYEAQEVSPLDAIMRDTVATDFKK